MAPECLIIRNHLDDCDMRQSLSCVYDKDGSCTMGIKRKTVVTTHLKDQKKLQVEGVQYIE